MSLSFADILKKHNSTLIDIKLFWREIVWKYFVIKKNTENIKKSSDKVKRLLWWISNNQNWSVIYEIDLIIKYSQDIENEMKKNIYYKQPTYFLKITRLIFLISPFLVILLFLWSEEKLNWALSFLILPYFISFIWYFLNFFNSDEFKQEEIWYQIKFYLLWISLVILTWLYTTLIKL